MSKAPFIAKGLSFVRNSVVFQYIVYLLVAILVSVQLSYQILYPTVQRFRCETFQQVTEMALKEDPWSGGIPDITKLDPIRKLMLFEVWVTDDKGRILAGATPAPLPLSWEAIQVPKEEMTVLPTSIPRRRFMDLYVIRLVSPEPRFLIYFPSQGNPVAGILKQFIALLSLWMFGVCLLGLYFVLRWKASPPSSIARKPLNESGFSLLTALVGLVIMAIALVSIEKMLLMSFRGGSHADIRDGIRSLSSVLKQKVDCPKTFAGVDLATACDPNRPLALTLKDRNGAPITQPLIPGAFTPLDSTVNGAGQLGNWYVRSYCDSPTGNLVVRFSRLTSDATPSSVNFYPDPLNKRTYDWQVSDTNPLFGTSDRVLCTGSQTGGGSTSGSHIVSMLMDALPITDPMRDCTSSIAKNGKAYLIAVGAAEYALLIPDSTMIVATVTCPDGEIAISGGAQCGAGFSSASAVASLFGAGHVPGYIAISQPTNNGTSWSTACCVEGTPNHTAHAYAVCVPPPQ